MPVINTQENPMNPAQPFVFAKGIIQFIKIDKYPQTKVTHFQGKAIEATHRAAFKMKTEDDSEELWVNMGDQKLHPNHEDHLQVKVGETWTKIETGMLVTFPVKITEGKDKEGNLRKYAQGNKSKLVILSTGHPVTSSQQTNTTTGQQANNGSTASSGASDSPYKLYGEVKAINSNKVDVLNQADSKTYTVELTPEQLAKAVVGGRLAATFVGVSVKSGFKTYAPLSEVKQYTQASSNKGAKDDLPIRLGNAVTIAMNLGKGTLDIDLAKSIVPIMDQLRVKLGAAHPELDAYALGARLGQSGVIASQYKAVKTVTDLTAAATLIFNNICQAEADLRNPPAQQESKAEDKPAPKETTPAEVQPQNEPEPDSSDNGPAEDYDPMSEDINFEFDDSIPFAPIGLQYGRNYLNTIA